MRASPSSLQHGDPRFFPEHRLRTLLKVSNPMIAGALLVNVHILSREGAAMLKI